MLEQYIKEEYHIVLDESVIALEDETKGTFYFAPDVVNFEVEEDDGVKLFWKALNSSLVIRWLTLSVSLLMKT